MSDLEITVEELSQRVAAGVVIVDVRTADEHRASHVEGAIHIPLDEIASRVDALRGASLVVTVCAKGGGRSLQAARLLRDLGVPARYLAGGTLLWLDRRST